MLVGPVCYHMYQPCCCVVDSLEGCYWVSPKAIYVNMVTEGDDIRRMQMTPDVTGWMP